LETEIYEELRNYGKEFENIGKLSRCVGQWNQDIHVKIKALPVSHSQYGRGLKMITK
jgi:hypothetical protein